MLSSRCWLKSVFFRFSLVLLVCFGLISSELVLVFGVLFIVRLILLDFLLWDRLV